LAAAAGFAAERTSPRLTGKVGGKKNINQPGKRAQFACFDDKRLKFALGREDPVEFGKSHGDQ
jgi:hypothetical protein